MKKVKSLASMFALVVAASVAMAKDGSDSTIKSELNKVAVAEMPAKAASLVSEAKPESREAKAAAVVRMAVKSKPAVTLAVVGAISRQSPEVSPTVAATAAELQPKQARQIAQAAAAAAPAKATEIVKAVGKVLPKSHREVAQAVIEIVPKASQEILATVPTTSPDATGAPDTGVLANNNRPPTIGPPFVPLSTTPTNVPPGGGQVPTGGRDYARP